MKKRNTLAIVLALVLSALAAIILWIKELADIIMHPITEMPGRGGRLGIS